MPLHKELAKFLVFWFNDHRTLLQAFFVALSLHVVLFPVLWIMGWALPWPKYPVFTTIIEYDLRGWPAMPKPKKVYQTLDPELSK